MAYIFIVAFYFLNCLQVSLSVEESNKNMNQKNVLGAPLQLCSTDPMTGWNRDGYCRTDKHDHGVHTVCATMTRQFLEYTKSKGNDLSSPNSYFPGLRPGDSWCLCAGRWEEARRAGKAPKVNLAATNEVSLGSHGITVDVLRQHAANGHYDAVTCSNGHPISNEKGGSSNDLCEPQK